MFVLTSIRTWRSPHGQRCREPFFRRAAAVGCAEDHPAVGGGRRHPVGARSRSARHLAEPRRPGAACLEHGLGRGALDVALFPARRRDRGADLARGAALEGGPRLEQTPFLTAWSFSGFICRHVLGGGPGPALISRAASF